MKLIDYYEIDLPTYALSYLVNGDGSGLEDSDIETIDAWLADMQAKCAAKFPGCTYDLILRDDDEGGFVHFPDFGLACNCVEAVYAVWAGDDDPRPAFPLPWEDEEPEGEEPEDEEPEEEPEESPTPARKKLVKLSLMRTAAIVGVVLWSAHYHRGQWSREYRIGCRARTLVERSNEIGAFLLSRWFDALEHYASGETDIPPAAYSAEFSERVRAEYRRLAAIGKGDA